MKQLTNKRNIAFLPGETGTRQNQWLLHTPIDWAGYQFQAQADFKGKTPEKSKEERPEFLPGELGVRTVRACQPTTKPEAPHFFYQINGNNFFEFLPGETV